MGDFASIADPITERVRELYENFPYPRYPLLGQLKWQEGYLASSKFAACLFEHRFGCEAAINAKRGQFVRHGRTVLVAGAGEALPYIIRKFEPANHRLLCVDLSQRSLRRARWRLRTNFSPTEFIRSDIDQFLKGQASVTGPYNHVDIYGVLHHLANPSQTIELLSSHLSPNGTIRAMVYNSNARAWIHHLQGALRLMKLDPYRKKDRELTRELLQTLTRRSPALRYKLQCLGSQTLRNDARLVDTFFHVRETHISLRQWFELFDKAGLRPYALLDRYAELDDLANPLWEVPCIDLLEERALDHRFENNLELYLCHKNISLKKTNEYKFEQPPRWSQLLRFLIKSPPRRWFQYEETAQIPRKFRRLLWLHYIGQTAKTSQTRLDPLKDELSLPTLQRLARIGVVFPQQFHDPALRKKLAAPMQKQTAPPDRFDRIDFAQTDLRSYINRILDERQLAGEKRCNLVIERLTRAQS